MDQSVTFTHERLDAFVVARDLVTADAPLLRGLPRGEAAIGDQLKRAADSVLLNTCEAAGRRAGPDKARFFDIARGSATECGGARRAYPNARPGSGRLRTRPAASSLLTVALRRYASSRLLAGRALARPRADGGALG